MFSAIGVNSIHWFLALAVPTGVELYSKGQSRTRGLPSCESHARRANLTQTGKQKRPDMRPASNESPPASRYCTRKR